ncbi:hypothetical protein DVP88_08365 [Yersinia enterocolitica]|nr:hypothetical protein [Yersinia enterocolitica]HEN3475778.1 YfbU family protein [Yersinia enterocolitica]
MKISDSEKLILIMLSDLYEHIGIEGEIDPNFIKNSIYENQTWAIAWKYPGISPEDTNTPPLVKEVLNILDMWRFITQSYNNLSESDQENLLILINPLRKAPIFKGFDGNNESEYLVAASFIINELDRFQEFKGLDLNSHIPSVDTYKRMLYKFEIERRNNISDFLSVEQLAKIFLEQIHPSNR